MLLRCDAGLLNFVACSQIVGGLFIIGWNIVWTSLILLFIKYALRIPLRMSDEELAIGDDAIHGVGLVRSLIIMGCINNYSRRRRIASMMTIVPVRRPTLLSQWKKEKLGRKRRQSSRSGPRGSWSPRWILYYIYACSLLGIKKDILFFSVVKSFKVRLNFRLR
jgi:hypothetical protein